MVEKKMADLLAFLNDDLIKSLMEKTRRILVENNLPIARIDIPKLFEQP